MTTVSGKLTKARVKSLGAGRHADGNGLYLIVDSSGARRWIVRVTINGHKNKQGKPLRTDYGLGGVNLVPLGEAREKALEYRRLAKQGIKPNLNKSRQTPTFEEITRTVHQDRSPTWKNPKHGQQWINTLSKYAFPHIGKLPVDSIGQPEVLSCLLPIWTSKHETARRVAQRIKSVLDVARSQGFRDSENPVTALKDAHVLPKVSAKPVHHKAIDWRDVPDFYKELSNQSSMAARALMLTCLAVCRTNEVLGAEWSEFDFSSKIWSVPAARMKTSLKHRVPITKAMVSIIGPLRSLDSKYIFEGQKRNRPLSNMAMLMLLRRMGRQDITVHGFRSAFRDWASEAANAPREIAELCLAHKVGSNVERAYARSDLLEKRRILMGQWSQFVVGQTINGITKQTIK